MKVYITIISGELQGARGYVKKKINGIYYCVVYKKGQSKPIKKGFIIEEIELIKAKK